jgi:hypothetical protein
MKKLVQQIMVLGLLGTWAVIAISSSKTPSNKCSGEWKIGFENNTSAAADGVSERDAKSFVEMYYPGFRSLILQ